MYLNIPTKLKTIKDKRGRVTKFYLILDLPQNESFALK